MKTSPKRLAANRANAAKSTGPRTEAGKARSAQNARTHGFTAPTSSALRLPPVRSQRPAHAIPAPAPRRPPQSLRPPPPPPADAASGDSYAPVPDSDPSIPTPAPESLPVGSPGPDPHLIK